VKLFTRGAAQGNAIACHNLGMHYAQGRVVSKDVTRAAQLYKQAADQGDAGVSAALLAAALCPAMLALCPAMRLSPSCPFTHIAVAQNSYGECAMQGIGVAHDLADAARNFRLAADQGNAMAQYWCGYLGECGKSAKKRDMADAVRMYRAAAAQGNVHALARLAVCWEKGRGVVQSEAEALASYAAASELGGAAALFASGVRHLDAVGERSAPESFTLQQRAVGELALAARLGQAGAVEKLASVASRREVASACCLGCGATHSLRLCARCRVAKFCDGECTRRAWPIHKPVCKQWQADAPTAEE
jgi:TPR repeat protein